MIPSLSKDEFLTLQHWCNTIAGYYGVPVYLCGSALTKKDPRDYDIRILLEEHDLRRLYGVEGDLRYWWAVRRSGEWSNSHWKMSEDCVKRTKDGWLHTNLNIDFQVQCKYDFQMYDDCGRMRMDTSPEVIV